MALFDDLSIKKSKSGYVVKYKARPLLSVNSKTFTDFFIAYSTKKFKDEVIKFTKLNVTPPVNRMADKLNQIVLKHKREVFGFGKNLKPFSRVSKEYKLLQKAAKIIIDNEWHPDDYFESQYYGLRELMKKNASMYVSPAVLASQNAVVRAQAYINMEVVKKSREVLDLEITDEDMELSISDNDKAKKISKKIKEGTASEAEAKFLDKLLIAKRGSSAPHVRKYLEKFDD